MLGTDHKNIQQFNENPKQFIVHIQDLIESVIFGYIRKGKLKNSEFKEVLQHVNEELLRKIDKIACQFSGKAQITTYFVVIVRNICNDFIRHRLKTPATINIDHVEIVSGQSSAISRLIIFEESVRLRKAIDLYFKQKGKLVLILKLKYRMAYTLEDFFDYNYAIGEKDYHNFNELVEPYIDCCDQKIYTALSKLFNKFEDRKSVADSLRKWISIKISELIEILNESPNSAHYNEDTFQLLFEYSYADLNDERMSVNNIRS